MRKFLQKDIFYIILILMVGLLSITWFRGNFLVNPGDTNFSFNPPNDLYRSLFVWDHQQYLGRLDSMATAKIFPYNLLLSLLTFSGFSIYASQKILFYLLFTFSGLTAYFLIRHLSSSSPYSKIGALLGANFYMMNSYLIQLRWGDTYYMSLFFYMIFPLLVLLWLKGRKTKALKFSVYFSLISLLALPTFNNIAYLIALIVICGIDLLIQVLLNLKKKQELISLFKFFGTTLLVFSFLFSFLIISQWMLLGDQLSNLLKSTSTFPIVEAGSEQTSILNLFRGLGYWGFFGDYQGDLYHPYSRPYNSAGFIVVGLGITLLSLLPLLSLRKRSYEKKGLLFFFALIFLIGLWSSKGVHQPLGGVYYWALDNIPFFKTLRFPHEKFGILMVIGTTVLISYSLVFFLENLKTVWKKAIFSLLFFSLINIYAWPFWTGDIWKEQTKILPGFRFRIPSEYYELKNFLTKQHLHARIFNLPDNATSVPGIISLNLENQLYVGSDPLGRLLSSPIFYLNDFDFDVFGALINNFYSLYLDNPDEFSTRFKKYSGLFNAKYIFLRGESDNKLYSGIKSPNFIEPFLNSNFVLLRKFGKVSIYEVDDDYFFSHFYIPQDIIYLDKDIVDENILNLADIAGLKNYEIRSVLYSETQQGENSLNKILDKFEVYRINIENLAEIELSNSSFEEGLWQEREKPEDCTAGMAGEPDLSMRIHNDDATEGKHSLELGSGNHYACTRKTFSVSLTAGKKYKYSFDYKNVKGDEMQYYYNLNGEEKSYPFFELIETKNHNWNRHAIIIEPKEDINSMDLYFYAPSHGTKEIVNRYDNVKLILLELKWDKGSGDKKEIESPILEFKKINPTKYKVVVHQAKDSFPLVFSESFNNLWKIYPVKYGGGELFNQGLSLGNYKVLEGNKEDQANREEIEGFIEKGWVSTLGDGEEKEIKHKKYLENGKEVLDHIEKYRIDFVSKNFQGTIQNDNLAKGYFWETWFRESLNEENHLMANGYANSWFVDLEEVKKSGKYVENPDGSIDFELIIEFWPQRLFCVGLFISGMSFLGCLGYLGRDLMRKKRTWKN